MSRRQVRDDLNGFGVEDDHAVVVTHAAQAYVFDAKGRRVATHDCRPLHLVAYMRAAVGYANGLAVVENLSGRGDGYWPALCAFRPDGSGPTLKASYDVADSVVVVDRGAYLMTHDGTEARSAVFRKLGAEPSSGRAGRGRTPSRPSRRGAAR